MNMTEQVFVSLDVVSFEKAQRIGIVWFIVLRFL